MSTTYRPVLACLALLALLMLPSMPVAAQVQCPLLCPQTTVSITPKGTVDVSEGGSMVFTVRRTVAGGANQFDLRVFISYTGDASKGADYTASHDPNAYVTIPSGQNTVDFTVSTLRDNVHAPSTDEAATEFVWANIEPEPNNNYDRAPGQSSARGSIQDIPPSTVTITASDATAYESQNPPSGQTRTGEFLVERSEPTVDQLVVNVQYSGSATRGVDYATTETTVTIPATKTSATIVITPIADSEEEQLEHVVATIVAGSTTSTEYRIGSPSKATVSIVDATNPIVSLEAIDSAASETPTSTVSTNDGVFLFSREGGSNQLTVRFTVSGTATKGTDYKLYRGTTGTTPAQEIDDEVVIPSGKTSETVRLVVTDDSTKEGQESATLTLTASTGYQLSASKQAGTVTIQDNDVPTVTVTASSTRAAESANLVNLNFARTTVGVSADTLEAVFTVSGVSVGTSSTSQTDVRLLTGSGSDLVVESSTASTTFKVRFAQSAASAVVPMRIVDDSQNEGTESAVVALQAPATPTYGVGTPGSVTIQIVDNDIFDPDGDGKDDNTADNCPGLANPTQANADADAQGDACDSDDDNDGLSDTAEDVDGDGTVDAGETNPKARDTDGDGRGDGDEKAAGTDPLDPFSPEYRPAASSITVGTQGDGIEISWVAATGSLADRYLVFRHSTHELVATVPAGASSSYTAKDTTFPGGNHTYFVQAMLPSQGGSAFDASRAVTGPTVDIPLCTAFKADTDGDGLCDRDEIARETDPTEEDTDGDGVTDGAEVEAGSDPLEPNTVGPGEVSLSRETPFWIGLVLAVATLVGLVVGIGMSRRGRNPAGGDEFNP